ncbi:MAG: uroporphyrinogen decarboxylase [Chloroflexi bacterium]|nr:uroporphyrinogen decarboxylase [Chloroflexota bacterium]
MNKRQRLQATVLGEPVDQVPVAFWRHFPGDDQDPVSLARATLDFQKKFDFDLVKVTPASSFCVEDWGVQTVLRGNEEGTRDYVRRRISSPADWPALEHLNVTEGALGRQLQCLRLTAEGLGSGTPFIQTIFSPLTVARYLRGDDFIVHLRRYPQEFLTGMQIIADVVARFTEAAIQTNAAGIFLAVQPASYRLLSEEEYRCFGEPFDRQVLDAAGNGWFNVLHLHGSEVMFDILAGYPVQAINWHDRTTPPTLGEARALFGRTLIGGIRQWETLLRGTPEAVSAEVRDALDQTGGRGYMVGAGCVIPVATPARNIRAAQHVAAHWRDEHTR